MNGLGGDAKALEIELRGLLEQIPADKVKKTEAWLSKAAAHGPRNCKM